jgi:effector-binding domain-containing protein
MEEQCPFACELRELTTAPALTIRTHTSMSRIKELFDEGYHEIVELLETEGRCPSGQPFARYYNMDMEDLDVEFGFPVDSAAVGKGRIARSETPSGKAATCLYIGPYNEIEPAYDALMKWIEDNRLPSPVAAYEIYLNDPAKTPAEMLKTQVHLLLREA